MTKALEVLQPGPLTTVQDLGRYGAQRFGVPPSGALDQFSHRVANLLAGNPEEAATLEMTLMGAKLKALTPLVLAVCGAEMPISINGSTVPLWTGIKVAPGDVLRVGMAKRGARSYLAMSGGIDTPRFMDSRSTNLISGLGGYEGRALLAGDVLHCGEHGGTFAEGMKAPISYRPMMERQATLLALVGPQDDYFDDGLQAFFGGEYKVLPASDRMGYRLQGPAAPIKQGMPQSIISEAIAPGSVQVPADGQPIIVFREQTVGGYPKIATILTPEISKVAQIRPGDVVRFESVSLERARQYYLEHEEKLRQICALLAAN